MGRPSHTSNFSRGGAVNWVDWSLQTFLANGHDAVLLLIVQVGLILDPEPHDGDFYSPRSISRRSSGKCSRGSCWARACSAGSPRMPGRVIFPASHHRLSQCSEPDRRDFLPVSRRAGAGSASCSATAATRPWSSATSASSRRFCWASVLALFLYTRLFNHAPHMQFRSVALFMGAAMSITAFPVLARILTERNLHKTQRRGDRHHLRGGR